MEEIYANLPSLRRVTVSADDGVIVLGGTVDDLESSQRATRLVERVTGAVIVVNNMTRDRSIRSRVAAAIHGIEVRLKNLAGSSPLLLLALAVIAIAVLFARLVGKARWLFGRLSQG